MKDKQKIKTARRERRRQRVRARVTGTSAKPRLSVKRSLRHVYAQLIDDELGRTLVACSDLNLVGKIKAPTDLAGKQAVAFAVGQALAQQAQAIGIKQAVFDRAGFRYHGRLKALASGARAGGLEF